MAFHSATEAWSSCCHKIRSDSICVSYDHREITELPSLASCQQHQPRTPRYSNGRILAFSSCTPFTAYFIFRGKSASFLRYAWITCADWLPCATEASSSTLADVPTAPVCSESTPVTMEPFTHAHFSCTHCIHHTPCTAFFSIKK